MKRTIDDAFLSLREAIDAWATGAAAPGVRVFVYPPEWEAAMLARFPQFTNDMAAIGRPIAIVDVAASLLQEVERRKGLDVMLTDAERKGRQILLHDLGELARRSLRRQLTAPLEPPTICRLFVNIGALATFVSYSALINDLYNETPAASILAFPGEGDDRSLNLLRLREDTNYRIPRI